MVRKVAKVPVVGEEVEQSSVAITGRGWPRRGPPAGALLAADCGGPQGIH